MRNINITIVTLIVSFVFFIHPILSQGPTGKDADQNPASKVSKNKKAKGSNQKQSKNSLKRANHSLTFKDYQKAAGQDDYLTAIKILQTLMQNGTIDEKSGHSAIAYCHMRMGNIQECIQESQIAIVLDPMDSTSYARLANSFASIGNLEQAEMFCKKALATNILNDKEPFRILGHYKLYIEDRNMAIQYYTQAFNIYKNSRDPGSSYSLLLRNLFPFSFTSEDNNR